MAAAIHSGTQRTAERIGELVHASHAAAMHAAKILRSAGVADGVRLGLWPNPGSGVRNTPVGVGQAVNLLVALGSGDPIRGPEVVAAFRSLPPGSAWWTHTQRVMPPIRLMNATGQYEGSTVTSRITEESRLYVGGGRTFGDDLDMLVEVLAYATAPEAREHLRSARIILTLAPYLAAEIQIAIGDNLTQHVTYGVEQIAARSTAYRVFEGSSGETVGVMEALAMIWRENQEALRPRTNETAASPGREAAAPNQPSIEREQLGPQTPRKVAERERNLNLRRSAAAGHSTFKLGAIPHDRRPFPAHPAAG